MPNSGVYLTQKCLFTSNSGKVNKQKGCRWMTRNKLDAKSVVLLHEFMHRNVYVMTVYQPYADSVLWRTKIMSANLVATF